MNKKSTILFFLISTYLFLLYVSSSFYILNDMSYVDLFNKSQHSYDYASSSYLWHLTLLLCKPISNTFGFNILPFLMYVIFFAASFKFTKSIECKIIPKFEKNYFWILSLINPFTTLIIFQTSRQGFSISLILFSLSFINTKNISKGILFTFASLFVHPAAIIFWLSYLLYLSFIKLPKILLTLKLSRLNLFVGMIISFTFYILLEQYLKLNNFLDFIYKFASSRSGPIMSSSIIGGYDVSNFYLLLSILIFLFVFRIRRLLISNDLQNIMFCVILYFLLVTITYFGFELFTEELMRFTYFYFVPANIAFIAALNYFYYKNNKTLYLFLPFFTIWTLLSGLI